MTFKPVSFEGVGEATKQHLGALPSAIDAFLEAHILASSHYQIVLSGELAGVCSVHGESLLTQFLLEPPYRKHAQAAFAEAKRLENVQAAFVPSCDEFFLSHALDNYRQLAKQAYFFSASETLIGTSKLPYTLRLATPEDAALIRAAAGDFFGDATAVQHHVKKQELFLTYSADALVGVGIWEKSVLVAGVASIGMFVVENYRRQGVGTAILQLLRAQCEAQGLHAVAGCWYYNHRSKKTLERAGMVAQTRLFKVDF